MALIQFLSTQSASKHTTTLIATPAFTSKSASISPYLHSTESTLRIPSHILLLLERNNKSVTHDLPINSSITMRSLRNVGSCDNAYLFHICTHWDDLADWTVFYKGTLSDACPPHFFSSSLSSSSSSSLSSLSPSPLSPLPSLSPPPSSNHTLCCPGGEREEGQFGFTPFFVLKEYAQKHHRRDGDLPYVAYKGNLGQWMKNLFGRPKALELFLSGGLPCFGGYFAAHRDTIRKQPLALYKAMKAQQIFPAEEVSLPKYFIFVQSFNSLSPLLPPPSTTDRPLHRADLVSAFSFGHNHIFTPRYPHHRGQ